MDPGAYQRRIPQLWEAAAGLGLMDKVVVPANPRHGLGTFLLQASLAVQERQGATYLCDCPGAEITRYTELSGHYLDRLV